MLLLRCSLLADSMSRSISFWPSTIATRSSSAWVALNSMRFMVSFRRGSGRARSRAKQGRAARGPTLSCGGRGRSEPGRALWRGADEGTGDGSGNHRWGRLAVGRTARARWVGWLRCSRVKRVGGRARSGVARWARVPTDAAGLVYRRWCAAQCAASNRPLAGCGDCALPLTSLLFRGATPGR